MCDAGTLFSCADHLRAVAPHLLDHKETVAPVVQSNDQQLFRRLRQRFKMVVVWRLAFLLPSWDILICSIESRTTKLQRLLAELQRQLHPGVGVRVFRDNLETSYGTKCERLMRTSRADYVSWVDDDDTVAPTYVEDILGALEQQPDYDFVEWVK